MICNQAYDDQEIVQRIDFHYDLFRRVVPELLEHERALFPTLDYWCNTGWAKSRCTVIILCTVYLLLAYLVCTRTWIMKLWHIWNSVSFQNRCVELLQQVHTVLRVHIRMPKVGCSSLLLYVYVYLYLVNSRCSLFEWIGVLMLNTIRTRAELLKI
jgi:hypothetical protein